MKVGVFDSGVGGLFVVLALKEDYPDTSFVYVADQKNNPYGSKSEQELREIFTERLNWFRERGIEKVIVACNTASSMSISELGDEHFKIQEIISPTCRQIAKGQFHHALVVATPVTVERHRYRQVLTQIDPQLQVTEIPLKELALMTENLTDEAVVEAYLRSQIPMEHYDVVILGCTHYPYYQSLFERIFQCPVLNSNHLDYGVLPQDTAPCEFYTTGDPAKTMKQIQALFAMDLDVKQC